MKKIISCLAAFLICCSVGAVYPSAAVIPGGGTVSPQYSYTNSITPSFGISNGKASCVTTVYGISGTTTKIVVTQHLQKKNGKSWDNTDVKSWTDTYDSWYAYSSHSYNITESGTYRLYSEATVYCNDKSEVVSVTSSEKTVVI